MFSFVAWLSNEEHEGVELLDIIYRRFRRHVALDGPVRIHALTDFGCFGVLFVLGPTFFACRATDFFTALAAFLSPCGFSASAPWRCWRAWARWRAWRQGGFDSGGLVQNGFSQTGYGLLRSMYGDFVAALDLATFAHGNFEDGFRATFGLPGILSRDRPEFAHSGANMARIRAKSDQHPLNLVDSGSTVVETGRSRPNSAHIGPRFRLGALVERCRPTSAQRRQSLA